MPDDKPEINSTVSTKLSTDQLICKSPPSSVELGLGDDRRPSAGSGDNTPGESKEKTPLVLYLGVLQILFGMLMAVCGVLVLVHDSNLAQTGGGLWGGCLAALTGVMGVFSAARDCCPLRAGFQRACHTAFLALSLVSLALAHLVLVIAAIGVARDSTSNEFGTELLEETETPPPSYQTILANVGLLLVSACECVAAAISAYQASRALCPCFRRGPGGSGGDVEQTGYLDNKHLMVTSWLGKQHQGLYAVVPAGKMHKGMSKMMAPVFTVSPTPSLLPSSVLGYPLIPAPLGTTPPPILGARSFPHAPLMRNDHRMHRKRKRLTDRSPPRMSPREDKSSQRKQSRKEKKRQLTAEELARTYTGLDRVIAEEFIEICDRQCHSDTSHSATSSDSISNEGQRK